MSPRFGDAGKRCFAAYQPPPAQRPAERSRDELATGPGTNIGSRIGSARAIDDGTENSGRCHELSAVIRAASLESVGHFGPTACRRSRTANGALSACALRTHVLLAAAWLA